MSPPGTLAAAGALLRTTLLLERRAKETVPAMALFTISTYVVFHFALDRDTVDGDLAAGVLLVTLLFAAMLGIARLFVAEREEGGLEGVLLAPIDRSAVFVAKAAALGLFLVAVELVAVPAFGLLLLGPDLLPALPGLALVLLLLDVAVAAVGTLVSGLAVQSRARELLVPLMGLPLLLPAVIAAASATAPLLALDGAEPLPGRWLAVLGLYDVVFLLLALAVFDFLLED